MESSEGSRWEIPGSRESQWHPSVVSSINRGGYGGLSRDASLLGRRLPRRAEGKELRSSWTGNQANQIGSSCVSGNEAMDVSDPDDISLRQWLDKPNRSVDLLECLHIFRQIVEIVNVAHSQVVVVHNIRPSCFIMSSFNSVPFIESASCSSSGSDSNEEAVNLVDPQARVGEHSSSSPVSCGLPQERSLPACDDSKLEISPMGTSAIGSEGINHGGLCRSDAETVSYLRSTSAYDTHLSLIEEANEIHAAGSIKHVDHKRWKKMPSKQIFLMENNWYTSPEETVGAAPTFASDIFCLGVLLFELFSTYSSKEEKIRTMSNLRHRVLPPQLLLKWPKEASFCLWLLHPQPTMRPKMSEVLQSEFLDEPTHIMEEREAAIKIKEKLDEQELLLEFLLQMHQRKQEAAERLHEVICCLSSDVKEVLSQESDLKKNRSSNTEPIQFPIDNENPETMCSYKRFKPSENEDSKPDVGPSSPNNMLTKSSRVMRNFKKLEAAYFSTRCKQIKPPVKVQSRGSPASSAGRGSNMRTEGSNFSSIVNLAARECIIDGRRSGWVGPLLEGLSKYLSFSKLKVRAELKQRDLLNSSNLVCSLNFDRDGEFFATAGINQKIKVFECNSILNGNLDIHYPVIEMASTAKLSSICWNSYIKHQIASSDFEGVVQVWDATRGKVFMDLREHGRRVWSVDFSLADPTRLASGSDDGSVKLWNINQGGSIGTIRTKANVCCVQFSPDSAHTIAIGSADHKVYMYDLRNTCIPWRTLVSHTKTVSYIKYIDSTTLVSASTDNTLKLWDLSMSSSRLLDTPTHTFTGHTNLKNFVGLSVFDGYIATGSETNEVFVYYKAFPMPVLTYKFSSTDPLTGSEIDDMSQFVSSVCWRGQTSTLVAASSTGNIKIVEMV